MRVPRYDVLALILLILISILPLFMAEENVRQFSHHLFFAHLLVIVSCILRTKRMISFMSPAILAIFYIQMSFVLGAYAFSNGFVLRNTSNFQNYLDWQHIGSSTSYILLCSTVVFTVDTLFRKRILLLLTAGVTRKVQFPHIAVLILLFATPFVFLPLDASLFGGDGDLSMIPKSVAVLVIIYFLARRNVQYRALFYICILVALSIISVDSKREAIFLIFPIFLLEFLFNFKDLRLSTLLKILIITLSLTLLIILMSIARGYGDFSEVTSLITAVPFLLQYIESPYFLAAFFNNIEVNYTYYHSMQALEYIQIDSSLLAGGSTLVKFLFILMPRVLWTEKPRSIIDLYTSYHAPSFREVGGSWPINLYAELFWNFSFFGLLVLMGIIAFFMFLYYKLLVAIVRDRYLILSWGLFVFMNFITYIRGSGLDMYVVYSVFAFVYVVICYLFMCIFPLKIKRK